MTSIGEVVRTLRERSPYHDLRSFAEHAGISYEGLRKIEVGERIPSIDTINQIIKAIDLNDDEARRLRGARDLAHAEREGLVNRGVSDAKIVSLADTALGVIESYLAEFEMAFEKEDANDLRQKLVEALEEELRG